MLVPDDDMLKKDFFNPSKLKKYAVDGVAWWDETHSKCVIGSVENYYLQFPRDESGKLDLEKGQYNDSNPSTILNVKYDKEIRLCLGCAVVEATPIDGKNKFIPIPSLSSLKWRGA